MNKPIDDTTVLREPREGSGLYYSLLYADPDARHRFLEQANLNQALADCLLEVREPAVAQAKVHWWHVELQRLHDGQARHPTTQRLQYRLQGNEPAMQALLTILSVAADERLDPADSDERMLTHTSREANAQLQLLAHALRGETTWALNPALELLAPGFGLFDRLRRLPRLLHRGFEVYSHERYRHHGCTPADLSAQIRTSADNANDAAVAIDQASPVPDMPDTAQAFLDHAVSEALQAFDTALHTHSVALQGLHESLAPLTTLAVLRQRQLHLWTQRRPNLLREWSTLTPVSKLFLAWRNRRGLRT